MRTQLLTHNKIAYNKVIKAFESSDKTCVVHPTGTCKSFLIAAVSEGYKRVLILGPNVFVLNQVHNVLSWRKDIEYMTYTMLMYTENPKRDYDLICLDEFHRAGAIEWGEAVDRLLEANPTAKVLGTTATPIRFLDDNRDMADELFEGNIASFMTLKDAWNRNILAVPTFVTGLFDFSKVCDDAVDRITKSHRINDDTRKKRLTRINNLRLHWEKSQGMPQIIRKHIDPKAKRVIVFCGNVEHLKDMAVTVTDWFKRGGFNPKIFAVHGYMPDRELRDMMRAFEDDDFDGVKVMLSVNMLNEGVHIPRVNGVILLRTTSSKIIYLQQIGRCLTAANTDKPVILDMVDNITTTNIVHDIKEGYDWYEHQKPLEEKEHEYEIKDFVVYDYTLGIQDAIKKLVPEELSFLSIEERIELMRVFCTERGRKPYKYENNDHRHWIFLMKNAHDHPEFVKLREKYGRKVVDYEDIMARVIAFAEKTGRLPGIYDGEMYTDWVLLKNRNKYNVRNGKPYDIRLNDLKERFGKIKSDERLKREFFEFINKHHRLPKCQPTTPRDELYLHTDIVKRKLHINDEEVKKLWDEYNTYPKRYTAEEKILNMMDYTNEHHCIPPRGTTLNRQWSFISKFCKDDPRVAEMRKKYGGQGKNEEKVEQQARELCDFIIKMQRPPIGGDNPEAPLYHLYVSLKKLHPDNPMVKEMVRLKEEYGVQSDEDYKKELKAFVAKKNRFPSSRIPEEAPLLNKWNARKYRMLKDPEMQAIADMYIKPKRSFDDDYAKVKTFCIEKGRFPGKKDEEYRSWVSLRENYLSHPAVKSLAEKYGFRKQSARIDIDGILNEVTMWSDKHGKLPSSVAKDMYEKKLGQRYCRIKKRYADNPKVIMLKEKYPIQNRK